MSRKERHKMKRCTITWVGKGSTKKLLCVTHQQALFYIYQTKNGLLFVCQVGEDEIAEATRRRRILGEEESKRFDKFVGRG